MTLKRFHLIKEKFLFDDYESGLYFDLCPLHRPAGDELVFNHAIGMANESLHETDPANQLWYCTLFLNTKQLSDLPADWKASFSAKSQLLLFKAGFDGDTQELPNNLWFKTQSGGMVCSNLTGLQKDWIYWTNWNANMIGHRFRRVTKDEADDFPYTEPVTPPVVIPPIEEPETPSSIIDGFIHLQCPYCKKTIF